MPDEWICPHCGHEDAPKTFLVEDHGKCPNCRGTDPAGMRKSDRLNTWVIAAMLLTIGVMGTLALLPVTSTAREASPATQCRNNLKMIGLALHNYHDAYGSFPPAFIADEHGKRLHSWRVLLLPWLDQKPLYEKYRFDQPWDGPNNRLLHDRVIAVYACPSDTDRAGTTTSYAAIIGPQTGWPGAEPVALKDIRDGTANTVLLVEVHDSGIHWMEPRDLEFDTMNFTVNGPAGLSISSKHIRQGNWFWQDKEPYVHALLAEGSVPRLPASVAPQTVQALLTIDGGEDVGEPWAK